MQRSSPSVAALAAALAKAQCELVNPQKSLIGSIKADGGDQTGESSQRLFRYASLADGLEIVRKTLGQHEIATVQTTAIDQGAGIVNLTTMLAHASGEWIASDWPVCAVTDTAEPHRMGAALTYARRYALFTLVGIAGEDDLDAPDLIAPVGQAGGRSAAREKGLGSRGKGLAAPSTDHHHTSKPGNASKAKLAPAQSAAQRAELVAELDALDSSDKAASWAQRVMAAKNMLSAEDAKRVEEAFQHKLASLESDSARCSETGSQPDQTGPAAAATLTRPRGAKTTAAAPIDKSTLPFPERRRVRDKDHLKFVAKQPCLICARRPSDPHHLRFAQSRALSRKASDEFTVPLCRMHHGEVHRSSDETAWWIERGIDPMVSARSYWLASHPLPPASVAEVYGDQNEIAPMRSKKAGRKRPRSPSGDAQNYQTNPMVTADRS